jgi:hypothetical protein
MGADLGRDHQPGVDRVLYGFILLAAVLFLCFVGMQPPGPRSAEVPANQFSAARALSTLRFLMGEDVPHPIGSDPNAAVRNRVLNEFTKLGYSPQTQSAFDCNDFGVCATVQNVVVRLEGTQPGLAVLLAAHYDSVPAGPGDSDDGSGAAAVLEVARALKSGPAPLHSIIFLVDDGEEDGMLGARAFVDSHPWASEVRAAVNVDARGTSGQSMMFETGSANDWAIHLFAHSVAHPATSSLAYTVYKQLPNDTDFSIFKAASYQGFNFAIIGNEVLYHTPLDNLQNVNSSSMQHQGENALATISALANADVSNPPQSDAVYFDLVGHWTIHWAARWTLLFAALGAILVALQIGFLIWNGRMLASQYLWGSLAWVMELAVLTLLAYLLQRLIRLAGGLPSNWVAHPLPLEIVFWVLPATVVLTLGIILTRRAGFWGLWAGVWTWWALLSLVLAWQVPGFSYVVLIPLIVAALAGLPSTLGRHRDDDAENPQASSRLDMDGNSRYASVAVLLPLGAAAIVGFAPAFLLYDALGGRAMVVLAVLVGLVLTTFTPFCADLRSGRGLPTVAIPGIPIAALGLAIFAAITVPAYSARAPEHVNIEYWQDSDSGAAQWIVEPASGRLPEPIRVAATFHRVDRGPFPWNRASAFLADGPRLDLAPPTFTILEDSVADGKRSYHALLRSERGAPTAILLFPPGSKVDGVRVGGIPMEPQTARVQGFFNGWSVYSCPAMPAEGVEISFSLPSGIPVEISAVDQGYGLPADGQFLLKARPLTASPADTGDVTVVSRRVRLFP